MQEPHIYLKNKRQEVKITILERKDGQSLGFYNNDFLPVRLEYKNGKENFVKELLQLETYELLLFYCALYDFASGNVVKQSFSFEEPYVDFVLENIKGNILFTFYYKENEEDKNQIVLSQKFNEQQFGKLIEKVHQGCNLWIDDSELIYFREDFYDIEDDYYEETVQYRLAEVRFENSGSFCYYLCEDESIKRGDWAVVPTFFGKETVAEVNKIEIFDEDDLPYPLEKMKKVIKKYAKPLSKKIALTKWEITEPSFQFEIMVNFVFNKKTQAEFSIKDKKAYFNVFLNEYKDVYLDVYKEMLKLKPKEMQMTKGLWVRSERVLHVGFVEKKSELVKLINDILDKAKELKKHYVGIPCLLEKYRTINPKAFFKIALNETKKWISKNNDYAMEVLFCCPDKKLYEKFKKIYEKAICSTNSK